MAISWQEQIPPDIVERQSTIISSLLTSVWVNPSHEYAVTHQVKQYFSLQPILKNARTNKYRSWEGQILSSRLIASYWMSYKRSSPFLSETSLVLQRKGLHTPHPARKMHPVAGKCRITTCKPSSIMFGTRHSVCPEGWTKTNYKWTGKPVGPQTSFQKVLEGEARWTPADPHRFLQIPAGPDTSPQTPADRH